MAPFAYFRNHHRRTGSTPNSESPRSPLWKGPYSPFGSGGEDSAKSPSSFRHSAIPSPTIESPVSPLPPVLPPIRRVASKNSQEQKSHGFTKSDSNISKESVYAGQPGEVAVVGPPRTTGAPIHPSIPRVVTRRHPGPEPLKIKTTYTTLDMGLRRGDPPLLRLEHMGPTEGNQRFTRKPVPDALPLIQDSVPRPASPPILQSSNELHPPTNRTARRASSPSSSFSSFQKSISSSNLGIESSQASSKQISNSTAPRPAKPRINLLNPVSLLRRRRTAQNVENAVDSTIVSHRNLDVPAMNLPDDYDPRIKGKGVHDFNAPRPRRHHSINGAETMSVQATGKQSPLEESRRQSGMPSGDTTNLATTEARPQRTPESDHVTVFHENFDDNDANDQASTSGVNRESLANSSFLARMSRRLEFDSVDFSLSAGDSPTDTQQRASTSAPARAGERTSKSTVGAPSVRISSDQSTARSSISNETRSTSPPGSPPSKNQRGSLNLDPSFQSEGLPKHFSSNASCNSRFSFQLNSEATLAEEKALEEKGKEKAAKARQLDSDGEDGYDNSSDGINYEDMDDDETYEEEIPMINAVEDEEDLDEWAHPQPSSMQIFDDSSAQVNDQAFEGNTNNLSLDTRGHETSISEEGSVDSMYFDDGLIDDPSPDASGGFDESYFDSPVESINNPDSLHSFTRLHPNNDISTLPTTLHGGEGLRIADQQVFDHQPFVTDQIDPSQNGLAPLEKLDAYHDALASAATEAEVKGRFRRKPSVDVSVSDMGSDVAASFPLVSGFDVGPVDWSQSNFDDEELYGLEDDQMVAAANAEVLASDDSEFYGREFGFYGAAPGSDGEFYNGGFFGGVPDDLVRNASGMNASREPNLTPITERSEFSTRNSFISLHGYGSNPSAPNSAISRNDMSLPSPGLGLREIAASMNMDEDDMTLTQLMKLRKETFGGSSGSTSTSLANGSHLAMHGPPQVQTVQEEDQEEYQNGEEENDDDYNAEHQPLSSNSNTIASRSPPTTTTSSETTPKPFPATTTNPLNLNHTPNRGSTGSSPLSIPSTVFHASSYSPTPHTHQARAGSPSSPTIAFTPPSAIHSAPTSPLTMPSPSLLHKFAARPPASSASYAERHKQRHSLGNAGAGAACSSGDSVAYVMEDSNWFLERRRRLSSGEMVIVGRELVEGGRI